MEVSGVPESSLFARPRVTYPIRLAQPRRGWVLGVAFVIRTREIGELDESNLIDSM